MNKVILMGRLTKNPEVRVTPTDKVVASFTLAVDRPFTNQNGQREADFINVVVWGKAAELIGNSCAKGHRLLIEGRMQVRNYDAKDGSGKRYVTEVIADRIEFVERKANSNNSNAGQGQSSPQESVMTSFGSDTTFNEEIPF